MLIPYRRERASNYCLHCKTYGVRDDDIARPCRGPGRRDQEARLAAHAAAQLRHAPARARCRYSRDSNATGHAKLDTTALYTRVANTTIRAVTSPLDRLAPLIEGKPRPEV